MSKGVKRVIGLAASIAIPFVAPTIAASLGASSAIAAALGSTTAGNVLGSALVGTALGGAKGILLGGDIKRNALIGGLGGAIGGYLTSPSAASAATAARTTGYGLGSSPVTGIGPPATGLTSTMGNLATFGPADYSLAAGTQFPTTGLNPATAGIGLRVPDSGFFSTGVSNALAAGVPVDYSLAAYTPPSTGLQTTFVDPFTGNTQVVTGSGVYQSAAPLTYARLPSAPPKTFMEALKQVPAEIAAKFSDPKALADLTLRAAAQLAGAAFAGDGLSDEERRLLDAQTEELRALQQTNRELFNQRLAMAQKLIGEADYFDPEYFGLQSARRTQIAGARAKRAGLRGLEGPARQAEARRFDLAMARDVGTAFDVGYGTGVQGRLQTIGAGINAMPQGYPSSMSDYTSLRGAYNDAAERIRKRQEGIGTLFGSLTGR